MGPVSPLLVRVRSAGAALAAATDRFLSPQRLLVYPVAVIVTSVLLMGVAIGLGDFPRVVGGEVLLPDFLAHWTGGRMLVDGTMGTLYDPVAQAVVQARAVGGGSDGSLAWFVAPPFAVYLYAPFALIGYGSAAVVWTLFSAACLVLAGVLARPFAPRLFREHPVGVVVVLLATQPVFELLGSGQDSGLAVLLWVAGIRLLLSGHDVAGGVILALGLFKPQLFVVVPLVLLAQGRWRALAAWCTTAAGLGLLSVQAVGVEGVLDWVTVLSSEAFHTVVQSAQAWKMQSLPALATTAGLPAWAGTAVAVVAALVFVRQLGRARSRGVAELPLWMLALLATFVTSPHVVVYDLVVALVPLLWLVEHVRSRTVRLSCLALFVLTWTIPVRHLAGGPLDLAWSAIPLTILWVVLARSIGVTGRPDEHPQDQVPAARTP